MCEDAHAEEIMIYMTSIPYDFSDGWKMTHCMADGPLR